jgi:glycosyltransferase involved in cell wall biosynthesis
MDLCVAIPTRNRVDSLLRAAESVVPQLESGDEFVIVDDGSSDGTAEVVNRWLAENCPQGRLISAPHRGTSGARNAALTSTAHPVVCFLDDDERVADGWLDALRGSWGQADERVAVIGGPMRADWLAPRPPWLADYLLYVVSILDLGPKSKRLELTGTQLIWGGNMSVRVAAALEAGGFDPARGARSGVFWERGEEEELQERLLAAGWEIWYEPGAVIDHVLGPERLTVRYFEQAFRNQALADAARGAGRLVGALALARGMGRYALLLLKGNPQAPNARFSIAYGWSLLTARRS